MNFDLVSYPNFTLKLAFFSCLISHQAKSGSAKASSK